MKSPGAERRPPSIGWRNKCNVLHNDGNTRGRELCAIGLTSGNSSGGFASGRQDDGRRAMCGSDQGVELVADFRC
jgi:hypothetical protein